MYIIGAGMSGCLAGIMNGGSTIFEAAATLPNNHHGILRFKTDNISKITGIPFKKVKVYKSIWYEGNDYPMTPRMANMYSKKVIGKFQERSILNIEPSVRYVAPDNFHEQLGDMLGDRIKFRHKVDSIDEDHIDFSYGMFKCERKNRPIISTIPMNLLAKFTSIKMPAQLLEDDTINCVHIMKMTIPGANIYQTIYYPEPDMGVYRASMSGDTLIVETMKNMLAGWELSTVMTSFGFQSNPKEYLSTELKSELGKFAPIDDAARKSFMLEASTKLNIWSLGRYACWRPSVLLDDVYYDILKIRSMIGTHTYDVKRNTLMEDKIS